METESQTSSPSVFPVVGIGASAGGLDALEVLFSAMPRKTGAAFVIVQHLSPNHKSLMEEILARHTEIPITRATDGMPVKPDHIYLNSPRKVLLIENGKFRLSKIKEGKSETALHLPIDDFFTSLAVNVGTKAVGVVLSGTGKDGSRGIDDIKKEKGFVIVQDPHTAAFTGMPLAAIDSRFVDITTAPVNIPEILDIHFQGKDAIEFAEKLEAPTSIIEPTSLQQLFSLLKVAYGIDFASYRPTTVDRRIDRRIRMTRCGSLAEYVGFLTSNPKEIDALYCDLLIGVTQFFRDTGAFKVFENTVIPLLFKQAEEENRMIRAWTAGCANGAEAYSIAILFDEYKEKTDSNVKFKIFATDVHPASITKASEGRFDSSILEQVSSERLNRYFQPVGKNFRVKKELREKLLFAVHNVMNDPPFTNLDLVVCRNMLIYFEPQMQQNVLSFFNYGLKEKGILFLGHSETLAESHGSFKAVSEEWRIYQSTSRGQFVGGVPKVPKASVNRLMQARKFNRKSNHRESHEDAKIIWAYEALLGHYAKRGFLVDERHEVLHVFGDATEWIRPQSGRLSNLIENMLPSDVSSLISAAIHRASRDDVPVEYKRVTVGGDWGSLLVTPLTHPSDSRRHFFITVERLEPEEKHTVQFGAGGPGLLADLQSELDSTKEHLQAANEELETSNEELQATNQEMMAANEELQSTNEELQSTNEELQSTNEELHSVNTELQSVNTNYNRQLIELTQVTADLQNILHSTDMGVVFFDSQLKLRKFTPAANMALRLSPSDIGKPLTEITHDLEIDDYVLNEMALRATIQGSMGTMEVKGKGESQWMTVRVLPYTTDKGTIEGAVITILNTSEQKHAEIERATYTAKLEASSKNLQDFAYMASHDLKAPLRNIGAFADLLKKDTKGIPLGESQTEYLEHIMSGVQKSEDLVEGLLKFSRVETAARKFVACDANDALERALSNLRSLIDEKEANIQRTLLPKVIADPTQLTQLLQSLVSNALVYCDRKPEIKIVAEHQDNDWLFEVTDNGIGINKKDHDRIFTIFQRLNSEEKYTGNGIGLAICRRIIDRHGGQIWVESTPKVGTKVKFTLPFHIENKE